jgi:hypothetical protein
VGVVSPDGLPDGLQSVVYARTRLGFHTQHKAPIVLEQYVRACPTHVEDPLQADTVFVCGGGPFYPGVYRFYSLFFVFQRPREWDQSQNSIRLPASANLSKLLVPAIQSLPISSVLVFVMAHVDCYNITDEFIFSQIRPSHPKRIITSRRTRRANATTGRRTGATVWKTS